MPSRVNRLLMMPVLMLDKLRFMRRKVPHSATIQERLHRGQVLTERFVRTQQVINVMIQKDYAYILLLKNLWHAWFQGVMCDVLGMIRVIDSYIGIPTWFLTLSAADMQWPDIIQTIAKQYDTNLSDEDIRSMSFQEKSKVVETESSHWCQTLSSIVSTLPFKCFRRAVLTSLVI